MAGGFCFLLICSITGILYYEEKDRRDFVLFIAFGRDHFICAKQGQDKGSVQAGTS